MTRPRRTGRGYRQFTLGDRVTTVHAWTEAVARAEASCPYDHTRRTRDGDHVCLRCCDLFALALIYATCGGEMPALVVLDRLLDALESGKVAA